MAHNLVTKVEERKGRPRSSKELKTEIQNRLGFFPPFFDPALDTPDVLENLWQQTLTAYIHNPIPALFKEKLFAYLSRYCTVPYCIVCHSCALRPLGMTAREVLDLVDQAPKLDEEELTNHSKYLSNINQQIKLWPEPDSTLEECLFYCSVFIFLNPNRTEECQTNIRRVIGNVYFNHLFAFLAYIKSCHLWVEAHPEIAYEADKRVQDNYSSLLKDDPSLGDFFHKYREKVMREREIRKEQLTDEITELKRTKEALTEKSMYLDNILRGSTEYAIATTDLDFRITYYNPMAEKLHGYKASDIIGKTVQEVHTKEKVKAERFEQGIKNIQARGEHRYSIVKETKKGKQFIDVRVSGIYNSNGELVGFVNFSKDVTKSRQAEEALRTSEERYRQLVELSPDIIGIHQEGEIMFINSAGVKLLGAESAQQIVGKHVLDFVHPDDKDLVKERIRLMTQKKEVAPFIEEKFVGLDGSEIDVEVVATPFTHKGKTAIQLIGRNITDRKRAEEELKFRLTLEELITTIATRFINIESTDIDFRIEEVLAEIGKFVGVDRSYVFQFYDNDTRMDNTHEWCAKGIKSQIKKLKGIKIEDFSWSIEQIKNGKVVYIPLVVDLPPEASTEKEEFLAEKIQSLIFLPMNYGGKAIGFLGFDSVRSKMMWSQDHIVILEIVSTIFANALEHRRSEEALKKSRERYIAIFESAGEGIIYLDRKGYILEVNDKLCEVTGISKEELIGKHAAILAKKFLKPKDIPGVLTAIKNTLTGAFIEPFEVRYKDKVFEVISPPVSKRAFGITVILRDITERKLAEDEIKKSREQLRAFAARLQETREDERLRIARELHDELGHLLTAIKIDLMSIAKNPLLKKIPLTKEFQSVLTLTNDALSSIKRMAADLRPGVLDQLGLRAAIEWQLKEFQSYSHIQCRAQLPVKRIGLSKDKNIMLFRILQETLTNIVRHAKATKATVSLEKHKKSIVLTVEDDGIGIEKSKVTDANSLGLLGMSERVHLIGGEIKITGEKGQGTVVRVSCPN